MLKKLPNPVDVHVGGRLKMRRVLMGISQEKLGESLDVTFQQIQKYEKGANRISASRLYDISRILSVPVQFFFDGIKHGKAARKSESQIESEASRLVDLLSSADGAQFIRTFSEIEDDEIRQNIIDLVKSISDSGAR